MFIRSKPKRGVTAYIIGVFERRTATGNETFSFFTRLGATTLIIISVIALIETIYLKIRAHPLPKNEKRPLPVAVRRSKIIIRLRGRHFSEFQVSLL